MKLIKTLQATILAIGLFALPLVTKAALVIPNPAPNILPGQNTRTPAGFLFMIINILLSIAGLLAVLFVIIGGFQYIISGANAETAETAKKTIQNAIIGLIVIILSFVIVNVINTALG
jgi:hypothetical protein